MGPVLVDATGVLLVLLGEARGDGREAVLRGARGRS
jgi:hypothetical protein